MISMFGSYEVFPSLNMNTYFVMAICDCGCKGQNQQIVPEFDMTHLNCDWVPLYKERLLNDFDVYHNQKFISG